MAWRLAKSLEKLRSQINEAFPKRSKASDGTIGDTAHSSRASDHNPDAGGVVRGMDITNDPAHGVDSERLANALLASRDPRIKYVISNKKIASGAAGPSPWVWRKYSGKNPHNHHVHISVVDGKAGDGVAQWKFDMGAQPPQKPVAFADLSVKQVNSIMHLGSKGDFVKTLQENLNRLGYPHVDPNGVFGADTEANVKAFQKDANLDLVDGWAGPATVSAIAKELEKRKTAPKMEAAGRVVDAAAGSNTLGGFSKTEVVAAVAGTTGTANAVKEGVDAVNQTTMSFMDLVSTVGPWVLLAVVLAGGAAFIVYDRRRKRLEAQAVQKVL